MLRNNYFLCDKFAKEENNAICNPMNCFAHFLPGVEWNSSQRIFTNNLHNSTTINEVELISAQERYTLIPVHHSSLLLSTQDLFLFLISIICFSN